MHLRPLPIQRLLCCWSAIWLKNELPITSNGNVYETIMVDHFSKWIKISVKCMTSNPTTPTKHFDLVWVLSQFGACADA